jgi:hypothetical protein
MPGITANPVARIAERLVLQPFGIRSHRTPICDEKRAVARNEMCHRPSHPDVAVQPESAGHRVRHPLPAAPKLTPVNRWRWKCWGY